MFVKVVWRMHDNSFFRNQKITNQLHAQRGPIHGSYQRACGKIPAFLDCGKRSIPVQVT